MAVEPKQQSRRRYAANGFAFVPQDRAVPHPSHGIGRVVEPAVRGLKHQPDDESITLAQWFVVANVTARLPMECRGSNALSLFPCGPISNFLHAFGDDFRELHHLLAQCAVFLNLALNAFTISLQFFPQPSKVTNKIINLARRIF